MAELTADQRNYYYLLESARAGIHKSILAALYATHRSPSLADGELGLGIAPANRIPAERVNTFPAQVQFAANTIRSITDRLTALGWKGNDLWNAEAGRYSDRFLQNIAEGYTPPANDAAAARLEANDSSNLIKAYIDDLTVDYRADELPQNLSFLDSALLSLVERVPRYYQKVPYQREALLEALRIWRKLDTREAAIQSLNAAVPANDASEAYLDPPLLRFVPQITTYYGGYPHQREAMLRLTQLWRQLDSREEAIASLRQNTSPETNIGIIDPALMAFVQRLPKFYQGKGDQRNALTEALRLWRGLDTRTNALISLGINPQLFAGGSPDQAALMSAASQLDRELLAFVQRIPGSYQEQEIQREALLRLVQIWRGLDARDKTVQSLLDDVRRMEQAQRDSPDAPPKPEPQPLPARPASWTTGNIQLFASIIPNGSFTWAEATHGGTRMPPNQATVDAVVRIARMAQQARDRIGRPFRVTSWYRPPAINRQVGGASLSRHIVGDAIDFYVEGLTGDQLYWALDPWWPGGLGRYRQFPNLGHIDARTYRARWQH